MERTTQEDIDAVRNARELIQALRNDISELQGSLDTERIKRRDIDRDYADLCARVEYICSDDQWNEIFCLNCNHERPIEGKGESILCHHCSLLGVERGEP